MLKTEKKFSIVLALGELFSKINHPQASAPCRTYSYFLHFKILMYSTAVFHRNRPRRNEKIGLFAILPIFTNLTGTEPKKLVF